MIILINAAFLIIEHQMRGYNAELVLQSYPASPGNVDTSNVFEHMEYAFLSFYVCEIAVRIAVLRKMWCYTQEDRRP